MDWDNRGLVGSLSSGLDDLLVQLFCAWRGNTIGAAPTVAVALGVVEDGWLSLRLALWPASSSDAGGLVRTGHVAFVAPSMAVVSDRYDRSACC